MYRRPFMSLFDEVYKLVKSDEISQDSPKLHRLPCKAAQEVQLAAVLCPLFATDLSADFLPTLFATDASDAKGAVVAREISEGCSSALEDGQEEDQLCMLTRAEAVVRKLDWDSEEYQFGYKEPEEEQVSDPERPRAFRFHFIEVCSVSGKITKSMQARGWVVGPVLHLDLENLKVISCLFHLVARGWLDSFMVEPPCTTFSPAQHPASRRFELPRGYDRLDPKTLKGTTLALRALALMKLASLTGPLD